MRSGFVVARADLVVVLRAWLPTLTDLEALPDGRFLLRCTPSGEPSS